MDAIYHSNSRHCSTIILFPDISFARLGFQVCGKPMQIAVDVCIIGCQVAVNLGFITFMREFLTHVMCAAKVESFCDNELFPLLSTLIIIAPLSLVTNFHYFYMISCVATFIQLTTFIILSASNSQTLLNRPAEASNVFDNLYNFSGLSETIGNFIFTFEGIAVIMELRSSMQRPGSLTSLLCCVMTFVCGIYILFPMLGYSTFGSNTKQVILFNYDLSSSVFFSVCLCYSLTLLMTFPMQFFPILEYFPWKKNLLFRGFLVILFGFGAYFFNNLQKMANLFGSLFAGPISFIIPIIIYNRHYEKTISKSRLWLNNILLVFAFGLSLLGIRGALL
eukprot:TRINITY_DN9231_c0_g1_i2.p1 TRINITY_DN9231_c0_g1~~TRINITY_DN9231_c0_g1_i2.p1  ORF type:complete len:335 (+),score=5.06 TRINITY_DN9231_c0_g1_i2:510-1514(+)